MENSKKVKVKTPLEEFIEIQNMQHELDRKKIDLAEIRKDVRSLSQLIPQKLRELNLQ